MKIEFTPSDLGLIVSLLSDYLKRFKRDIEVIRKRKSTFNEIVLLETRYKEVKQFHNKLSIILNEKAS